MTKGSTLMLLVSLVPIIFSVEADAQVEQNRPNIVILFADDLGYGDLGSYGHPYIRTPNLDELAQQGQRWTDFYVAAPVCSPSRAALLTGRLPVRSGLYGRRIAVYFPNEEFGFSKSETTFAELLQQAGYRTGIFGKWHLGDAKHAWPTRHGFDEWLGLPYSNDMDWVGEPSIDESIALRARGETQLLAQSRLRRIDRYALPKNEYWNVPLYQSRVVDGVYVDEVIEQPAVQTELTKNYTEAAISFIQRSKETPFLLYLPFTMPHTPLFRSNDFAGKSLAGRYGDVVEELDWSVGEIKQALVDNGVLNNTLFIFTSDNGPWLAMKTEGGRAGLLRDGKGTTFEGGMRVPAIFYWPGRIAPGVVSEIGSTLDIFTTLAKLTGLSDETATDGLDLTPVLFAQDDSPRTEFPYYRGGELYAFRKGAWKIHFITQGAYGQPPTKTKHVTPELYHLGNDPSERFNVAQQFPQIVANLRQAAALHSAGWEIEKPAFDRRLSQ